MKLSDQLRDYVNAAFSGIWIQTVEPTEAEREIGQAAKENKWRLAVWDADQGIRGMKSDSGDPLPAIRALPQLADEKGSSLLVMHNLHRFLANPVLIQAVANQLAAGKAARTYIVVLAPVAAMPPELEKLFVVIEHDLPDANDLAAIAKGLYEEPKELERPEVQQSITRSSAAATGLTRYEAEGAFALSLARHDRLKPEVIWELKAQGLRKSGLLQLHRGSETFAGLGGLESLKNFCKAALTIRNPKAAPRGVLLLGVPGGGKSAFAKALGNEVGLPTVLADPGAWKDKYVGESGQKTRRAFQTARAMSPCIFFVDEVEKALAASSGGDTSGVSQDQLSVFLTEMSNNEDGKIFFIATSNNIAGLPPEFSRPDRFDGIFFVDLPGTAEKDVIWSIYRTQYGISDEQARPDDTDWTGAEIKSCCRLAALLGVTLSQASHNVVPVARTAAESVDRLKQWASGRCLCANSPGVYGGVRQEHPVKNAVRKINRGSN